MKISISTLRLLNIIYRISWLFLPIGFNLNVHKFVSFVWFSTFGFSVRCLRLSKILVINYCCDFTHCYEKLLLREKDQICKFSKKKYCFDLHTLYFLMTKLLSCMLRFVSIVLYKVSLQITLSYIMSHTWNINFLCILFLPLPKVINLMYDFEVWLLFVINIGEL